MELEKTDELNLDYTLPQVGVSPVYDAARDFILIAHGQGIQIGRQQLSAEILESAKANEVQVI